ncbi:Retrovirus-related Pol polyprotein from transposon 17.6 [Araneus ventricosus]|uniref:Retrovirus-related Pol polyprotein from transposon 17.6 n=1 Tax=Araneus ventricosus TaxID=182803 RepID=A0A4Y2UYE3_ARAVE|nr:Retrovirus-related Pol polyprotein from transposon 17.6 [Araneus ventricosus]GBO18025.1 Retrovirus-related Pol polyprotein from transposon 17.6 [Araneus ventricosus]
MNIVLQDQIPVCQRARRLSFPEKQKVNEQITDWLNQGIIRESCSDYCSPLVLCKKKEGNLRLCIDNRKLNTKTVKDRYPLPLIEEVLDQLYSGKFFSTIDLKNGFFHVEMEENSKKFTSFVTPDGQYEFNKVPFGLCNSPGIFQRFINHVFRDLLKEGIVIIYMDDIIISSIDERDGLKRLSRVLQTASEYGLELNLKKCNFLKSKIEFLGYIIENGKISPSLDKTVAVQNFPKPKSVKQKHGKGEGFLNPIPKDNVPLNTNHIDFVGSLPSTNKRYRHIFTVVDAFTKFTWFDPFKSPSAQEAIDKLKLQQTIFGNPSRIITDTGSAFTAKEFETYCSEEGIQHLKITTGIPRGNGQIERMHRILIPVLSQLSHDNPTKWFKHVPTVQRVINSSTSRSTKYTPFELMMGTKMKNKEDIMVNVVLHEEYLNHLMHERDERC